MTVQTSVIWGVTGRQRRHGCVDPLGLISAIFTTDSTVFPTASVSSEIFCFFLVSSIQFMAQCGRNFKLTSRFFKHTHYCIVWGSVGLTVKRNCTHFNCLISYEPFWLVAVMANWVASQPWSDSVQNAVGRRAAYVRPKSRQWMSDDPCKRAKT